MTIANERQSDPACRALIFDFDGLIIDTESADFQSWQELYQSNGCSLELSAWAVGIGSAGISNPFDPYEHLEAQLGRPFNRQLVREARRRRYAALVAELPVLPGVREYVAEARRLGLRLGVASSSPRSWVHGHLSRLGLAKSFHSISCGDEVALSKPDPAVYLLALRALGVSAAEAVALEDSPNGILAANLAGIPCVAVPNALTRQLPLDHAEVMVESLAAIPLVSLLGRVRAAHRGSR